MKSLLKSYFKKLFLLCIPVLISNLAIAQSTNLPDWFLKSENYNSINCAIGVSSPNPDSLQAYKQAKIRALLSFSILNNSKLRALTTLSIGDQKNNRLQPENIQYIIYTNIFSGELPLLDSIEVTNKYYNQNKEAFVMLKIPFNYKKDSLKLSYTLTRRAAFERNQNNLPVAIDEIDFKIDSHDSIIENFHLERDGLKMYNMPSKKEKNFFSEPQVMQKFYYGLSGITLGDVPDFTTLPCPLYTGIWNSYLFNLIDQICIHNQFELDLQYKLTTSNIANSNTQFENTNFQQFVYTLKNITSTDTKAIINKIGVAGNQLFLGISPIKSNPENLDSYSSTAKSDKKEMKKLMSENWMVYGRSDFGKAWAESKILIKHQDYINSSVEVIVNNLQAGIIEAINIAKLELSSLVGSKINTLNTNTNSSENQLYLNTSKLSNSKQSAKISPQYIFYSKINNSLYRVRVVLFYKLI